MNWYKHHLGDYSRDTVHLTVLEHGAYRLLLDWLYSSERPIPDRAMAYRICRVPTHRSANDFGNPTEAQIDEILRQFFFETKRGFTNKRFEEELKSMQSMVNRNRANSKHAGRKPKSSRNPVEIQSKSSGGSTQQQSSGGYTPDSKTPTPKTPETTEPSDRVSQAHPPYDLTRGLHAAAAEAVDARQAVARENQTEEQQYRIDKWHEFWEIYPSNEDQAGARAVWDRLGTFDMQKAIDSIAKWKASVRWKDPRYVPIARNFLGQRKFEIEPPMEANNGRRGQPDPDEITRRNLENAGFTHPPKPSDPR